MSTIRRFLKIGSRLDVIEPVFGDEAEVQVCARLELLLYQLDESCVGILGIVFMCVLLGHQLKELPELPVVTYCTRVRF